MARSNLENKIIDDAGRQLAAEIDREIMWGFLEETGWVKVKLPRFVDRVHAIDVRIWLEENRTDEILQSGSKFLFKNPKDATMFILRWYDRT